MADITFECPECAHQLSADASATGLVVPCPECATQIRVPLPATDATISDTAPDEVCAAPELAPAAQQEYRVLSLPADTTTEALLTAESVEACLNTVSQEGWRLCSATTIPTRTTSGTLQQELLLILERPYSPAQ
jgi:hypothetical protein